MALYFHQAVKLVRDSHWKLIIISTHLNVDEYRSRGTLVIANQKRLNLMGKHLSVTHLVATILSIVLSQVLELEILLRFRVKFKSLFRTEMLFLSYQCTFLVLARICM